MMTKKREMAEWILDFFRKANVDAGQIVMMRHIQNKLIELNPKERDMFVSVANELIQNGYFTYEESTPQCLRLTQKGQDYIYEPEAQLDCCYDSNKLTVTQSQYIEQWHDSFVSFINGLLGIIEGLALLPGATEDDRQGLALCRLILNGQDVNDVEKSLSEGTVSQDILDKIEHLNKRLVDVAIENIKTDVLMKEFLKRLSYLKIEQDKQGALMRLNLLKIPVE
jgi:hypothetical protein